LDQEKSGNPCLEYKYGCFMYLYLDDSYV
jgi:hypothetical protein